jgi:NADPH:quinone reductase-like Zn-dependent oxidoreductase
VRAASVNPIDWKVRSGMMAEGPPDGPRTVGVDAAGVVDEVGEGVDDVAVGDGVFGWALGGSAAEHVLMEHYARKPDGLSFEEAAGYAVATETAARGLDLLGLHEGMTVLITGAAGGVGTAAVQFARERGLRVIGTASRRNHEALRGLGAEPTAYGEGLVERVRALAPDGVDGALDTAGRGVLPDLIELTGDPRRVVTIADFEHAGALGVILSGGTTAERAYHGLEDATRLHEAGRFSLPVERAFSFEEAAEAHRVSEAGHVRGKLVLTP